MSERHTTVHLRDYAPGGWVGDGQAYGIEGDYADDSELREEMALHALENAVLPILVALARDWRNRIDTTKCGVMITLTDRIEDNSELGLPNGVRVEALASGEIIEAL